MDDARDALRFILPVDGPHAADPAASFVHEGPARRDAAGADVGRRGTATKTRRCGCSICRAFCVESSLSVVLWVVLRYRFELYGCRSNWDCQVKLALKTIAAAAATPQPAKKDVEIKTPHEPNLVSNPALIPVGSLSQLDHGANRVHKPSQSAASASTTSPGAAGRPLQCTTRSPTPKATGTAGQGSKTSLVAVAAPPQVYKRISVKTSRSSRAHCRTMGSTPAMRGATWAAAAWSDRGTVRTS